MVVPPSLEKYRHFSQVLLLFLLISASVNSDHLFFMTSPSHDLIEILYVSGVYPVFHSVWDFLCANAFVCYYSDTGVILEYPRLEVSRKLYKSESGLSVKQLLFLSLIHCYPLCIILEVASKLEPYILLLESYVIQHYFAKTNNHCDMIL